MQSHIPICSSTEENISILNGSIPSKHSTKTRLKASRPISNLANSTPPSGDHDWIICAPKYQAALPLYFSLEPLPCHACRFPSWMLHASSIFNIMGSPDKFTTSHSLEVLFQRFSLSLTSFGLQLGISSTTYLALVFIRILKPLLCEWCCQILLPGQDGDCSP